MKAALLLALAFGCSTPRATTPDAAVVVHDAFDKNAECCALWDDPSDPDGSQFFALCSPTGWNECLTYYCPQATPVCTGSPP